MKSQHTRLFEQLVAEHRQALLESLVNIVDARIAGRIQGLDDALRLSEEADFKLSGDRPE